MKRIASAIMIFALVLGMLTTALPMASAADGDEIRAEKKIISVVYDDSGSMKGDRWVYANYAMQALIALLNEQDELYITYMSRPDAAVEVELSNIDGEVQAIRSWKQAGNTPGEALDTAKSKLDSISESDASTEFWLVILTDGAISMDESIQDKLNSFKGSRMSNQSALNVVYLAMGDGAASANGDKNRGLHTYKAATADDITGTMSEIANLISGRLTADNVKQTDSTTVTFTSALPMYSISVLSQNSSASVLSVVSAEQTPNVDRNIALNAYEPFGTTSSKLFGNAAVIHHKNDSGSGELIPADTYTITFSEPVELSELVIQYEPAIGMKAVITRDGIEIDDPSVLQSGEKINVEIIPVIPGTDEEIAPDSLPRDIVWSIEHLADGTVADAGQSTTLTGITLQNGDHTIRGTMQIPGFTPSAYELAFTIVEIVYHFGIEVDQPDPLSYYRKHVGDGSVEGGSLTFRITNDAAVLSKEEQAAIGVSLEADSVVCDNSGITGFFHRFGTTPAKCELTQNDDGSYTLIPQPVLPFTAFLMMAGDYTVTVRISEDHTITETGTFTMLPQASDWFDLGILLVILAAILYLIYIFFIKYKFKGQTVRCEVYRLLGDGSGTQLGNRSRSKVFGPLSGGLLLPTRACRVKFNGLILEAGPDGMILVKGKSIAKRVKFYGPSSSDPESSLGSIVAAMRCTERKTGNRTERTASDQTLSTNRPIYFRNTDTDKQVWRVFLRGKK